MTALLASREWREECADMADDGPAFERPDMSGIPLHVTRTVHYRDCPTCEGSGSVEDASCPNPDCLNGEIVEWTDPLLRLRSIRKLRARPAMRYSPSVLLLYGEALQEAVSWSHLPDSREVAALGWRSAA